jgi:hypothetical protein
MSRKEKALLFFGQHFFLNEDLKKESALIHEKRKKVTGPSP